jgi:uncharacterized membrane protein
MKTSFLNQLDHRKIVSTIQSCEAKTTGEIRVRISHRRFLLKDEMAFARREFKRMGMTKTPDRNGVLIVIFPARRKIVILGDEAIHKKLGDDFWKQVIQTATKHFKTFEYTEGILRSVEIVGKALAEHFPKTKSDSDSLSNEVVEN